jgi:hypothetical protein
MTTALDHVILHDAAIGPQQMKPPQDHLATLSHHAASGFILASTSMRVYAHTPFGLLPFLLLRCYAIMMYTTNCYYYLFIIALQLE